MSFIYRDGTNVGPISIRADVAQASNQLQIEDSTGVILTAFDINGNLTGAGTTPSGAVILAPATSVRNVIQPTADVIPLIIKGFAGQTADLTQWQDSASAVMASMSAAGRLGLGGAASATTRLAIILTVAANKGLTITGTTSQSGNLQEWQLVGGTAVGVVLPTGVFSCPGSGGNSERFGAAAVSAGTNSAAFGASASAGNTGSCAFGQSANASGIASICIGQSTSAASLTGAIALGQGANPNAANRMQIGGPSANATINSVMIGNGSSSATPATVAITVTDASGTDTQGGILALQGGRGTGAAIGGAIWFYSTIAGASASTLRTQQVKMIMTNTGALQFLQPSTVTDRQSSDITTTLVTATDATRKARAVFNIWDTAAREALRIEASGTAAMIGFLGSAAVVQQPNASQAGITAVLDINAKAALQAIYTLLNNYGLAPATA